MSGRIEPEAVLRPTRVAGSEVHRTDRLDHDAKFAAVLVARLADGAPQPAVLRDEQEPVRTGT